MVQALLLKLPDNPDNVRREMNMNNPSEYFYICVNGGDYG